jgi:hypothetical protein
LGHPAEHLVEVLRCKPEYEPFFTFSLVEHTSSAKHDGIFHLRSLRLDGSVVLSMGLFRGKVTRAQGECKGE